LEPPISFIKTAVPARRTGCDEGNAPMKMIAVAAVSFAALVLPMLPANAAGPYDGRWVVDFPSPYEYIRNTGSVCSPFRLVVEVKDSQLEARLQREPVTNEVENSNAANAVPVKGAVAPDGTVTATWEDFPVIGRLQGDTGAISVQGDCGPRTGRAQRVQ
jgi:hypothetical protein